MAPELGERMVGLGGDAASHCRVEGGGRHERSFPEGAPCNVSSLGCCRCRVEGLQHAVILRRV